MKDFFFLIFGLMIIFGSIFLFLERSLVKEVETNVIKINDASIRVEVVDTPKMREKGLSGREFLLDGTGMLFVFDIPGRYGFWMKDMNFAIDIVWIDENLRVIDTEKGLAPETFPQIFYPSKDIKYVLELPAGDSDRYRIGIDSLVVQ